MSKRFRVFKRKKTMGTAKKALKMVRKLKRETRLELKTKTLNVTTLFNNSGLIQDIPRIAEGVGFSGRTGIQIRLIDLEFKAWFFRNAVANTTFVRFMVFVDRRQESDSKTGVTNVLELADPTSPINNLNRKRYRVLRDRFFVLIANRDASVMSMRIKLGFVQGYNGSATTDIEKNGVYLLILSNQATNQPTIHYSARLRYTDV